MKQSTLKIIETALPFFGIITYFLLFVEVVTYHGFVRKIFLFDSRILAVLFLMYSGFLLYKSLVIPKFAISAISNLFFQLNLCLIPIHFLTYFILLTLENQNYPNYVYSTFHLQPYNYTSVLLFSLYLGWLYVLFNNSRAKKILQNLLDFKKVKNKNKKKIAENLLFLFTLLLLVYYGTKGIPKVFQNIIANLSYITQHPRATQDEKMEYTWKFFYTYMQFIRNNTPEDAKIGLPPAQSHWLSSGNIVLVRSFLYPREVYNLPETDDPITIYQLPVCDCEYLLLAKGLWPDNSIPTGWPKTSLNNVSITRINENNLEISREENVTYDPDQPINQETWGLIQFSSE